MITTCGIFIINEDGRILIVHPSMHDDNIWSIPKGELENGESYKAAALRELWEETDLKFSPMDIFEIPGLYVYPHNKKQLKAFYIKLDEDFSDINIICNSTFYHKGLKKRIPENDKHGWATYNQAIKRIHSTQKMALDYLKQIRLIE